MIQQPAIDKRPFDQIELLERLSCLNQTQEVEGTAKRADLAGRGDDRDRPAIDRGRSDHVAVAAGAVEIGVPAKAGNSGHALGRPDHDRTVGLDGRHDREVDSKEALDAAPQLVTREPGGRGCFRGQERGHRAPVGQPRITKGDVAEPEVVAGLGAGGRNRQYQQERQGERRFDSSSRQQQNV